MTVEVTKIQIKDAVNKAYKVYGQIFYGQDDDKYSDFFTILLSELGLVKVVEPKPVKTAKEVVKESVGYTAQYGGSSADYLTNKIFSDLYFRGFEIRKK